MTLKHTENCIRYKCATKWMFIEAELFFKKNIYFYFLFGCVVVFVQSLSHVQLFVAPRTVGCLASLSSTISQSLLKPMFMESMIHPTISSCHLVSSCPPIFPSIRVFSNELALHILWPKYWNFNFSISPSNE